MTARNADEYKLGSYEIVAVGTAGYDFKTEGYATLVVRNQKLSYKGCNLNPSRLF